MSSYAQVSDLADRLLRRVGVPAAEAGVAARALATADAWGVGSHGLLRLPYYLERFVAGGMRPDAALSPVSDTGPVVALDGHDGLGHPQVWAAAETAADRCAHYGVGVVSVGRSAHCGCLGFYVLPMLARGQIGLVFSTGPAVMAPWGGHAPVLSTSPLAAGIPCRPRPAIVDLATSAVARGKIAAYAKRDEALPEGWAVDAAGGPTTDPRAALTGMLAPLGGGKGFALALLVEALAGGAVGPALAGDISDMFDPTHAGQPQRIGHLVLALDPARLDTDGGASGRLDALAERVEAAGGRLPGARRVPPDEIPPDTPVALPEGLRAELAGWEARLGAR